MKFINCYYQGPCVVVELVHKRSVCLIDYIKLNTILEVMSKIIQNEIEGVVILLSVKTVVHWLLADYREQVLPNEGIIIKNL